MIELTERQKQVVTGVAEGLTAKEIAARYSLGQKTVEAHIEIALRKTGARGRIDLVHYALAMGWTQNRFAQLQVPVARKVIAITHADNALFQVRIPQLLQ